MIVQNILLANESYTHKNWMYQDVCVGFSRLYYILDGEAYYEEEGEKVRLKHGHIYLTPVKKKFTLTENPKDKLLHAYVHITTLPAVEKLQELRVEEGTLLFDAVTLWRKYVHTEDKDQLVRVLQLVLSCMDQKGEVQNTVAQQTKCLIDNMEDFSFDMVRLSRILGYTREHITRSFLASYRTTPHKYFNSRRMNVALEKLKMGESVGKVSELLNFASPYSFSKAFKTYFGVSPKDYRLILKEETEKRSDK